MELTPQGYSLVLGGREAGGAPGAAGRGGTDFAGEQQQWQESLPQESAAQVAREMSSLANRAALSGVTIDVVAGGPDPDQIPAISPLAQVRALS